MNNLRRTIVTVVASALLLTIGFIAGASVISSIATPDNAPVPEVVSIAQPVAFSQADVTLQQDTTTAQNQIQGVPLNQTEQTYADIYNRVAPSVVSISALSFNDGSTGTGFVVDQEGHIVTNFHVIQGAEEIRINFFDGTITRAQIIGEDPDSDLAVLKVDLPADRLIPVTFGSSDAMIVGQQVVAIGSPFGRDWTLTAGIVSALNRSIQGLNFIPGGSSFSIGGVIQTDAPINPGNSGGPLLNMAGQVVGVNAQIASEERANSGVGFAIPSDLVVRVVNELIANGDIDYSYVGISGGDVGLDVIEALNLPDNQRGLVVSRAEPGGPAAEAGLRSATGRDTDNDGITDELVSADIILEIDGTTLTGIDDLIAYLARETRPGDTVTLTVLRDGEIIQIPLTLASRPSLR